MNQMKDPDPIGKNRILMGSDKVLSGSNK